MVSHFSSIKAHAARGVIRLLSEVAPRAVGRSVFWRACRTHPPVPSDHATVAKAEQRLSTAARRTVIWGNHAVVIYTFEPVDDPPRPPGEVHTVALIHGWTGRAAFMTAYATALTRAGFRVVAMDLPGHGGSSGNLLHVPLAVETLHAVHRETGPWFGIAGHSFGGLAMLAAVSGTVAFVPPLPVSRLAVVAAPHDAKFMFDYLGRVAGIGRRAQAALDGMVMEVAGRPIEHFDGAAMIRTAGLRTLVMHAPDDREIPFSCAEKLASAAEPLATLAPIPGAGHRRILYSPAACELLAGFMAAGLPEVLGRGAARAFGSVAGDEPGLSAPPRGWLN